MNGLMTMDYPDSYLEHYGIKGQKWGVRNYQNTDGSLTDAGRAHYGYKTTNDGVKAKDIPTSSNQKVDGNTIVGNSKYINSDGTLTAKGTVKYDNLKTNRNATSWKVNAALDKTNKLELGRDKLVANNMTLKGKLKNVAGTAVALGSTALAFGATDNTPMSAVNKLLDGINDPINDAFSTACVLGMVATAAYATKTVAAPAIANAKSIRAKKLTEAIEEAGYKVKNVESEYQTDKMRKPIQGTRHQIDYDAGAPDKTTFNNILNTRKQKNAAGVLYSMASTYGIDPNSAAYKQAQKLIQRGNSSTKVYKYLKDALGIETEEDDDEYEEE